MSFGHAVGPQWAAQLPQSPTASHITLQYGVEVTSIQSNTSQPITAQHDSARHGSRSQQDEARPHTTTGQSSAGSSEDKDGRWPVTVTLSNGRIYGADIVISAIGVEPNTGWLPEEISRGESDGGVMVDRYVDNF